MAVVISTAGLAFAVSGQAAGGYAGGAVVGLAAVATHATAVASLQVEGSHSVQPVLWSAGLVLAAFCGALAIERARAEGRNVQVIAPLCALCGLPRERRTMGEEICGCGRAH